MHFGLDGMDLVSNVFYTIYKRIFYLRLALPGIDYGKAMDVAGWFHGLVFSSRSKSQVYTIKADGFWRKGKHAEVTKIDNSEGA
jgi:hypothetical protein